MNARAPALTAALMFLVIGGGHVGLLHKSEMAHEFVADPAQLLKAGDELEVRVIEVRSQRGARSMHTGGTQPTSNEAARDGSATMSWLFRGGPRS